MKRTAVAALSVLALGLAGCAGTPAEPEPVPTVTVTAEPVIEEVVVEVTPQACLDSIDQLADVVQLMGEIQDLVPPTINAAVTNDMAAMEALTSQVTMLDEQVGELAPDLGIVVNECRSSQ